MTFYVDTYFTFSLKSASKYTSTNKPKKSLFLFLLNAEEYFSKLYNLINDGFLDIISTLKVFYYFFCRIACKYSHCEKVSSSLNNLTVDFFYYITKAAIQLTTKLVQQMKTKLKVQQFVWIVMKWKCLKVRVKYSSWVNVLCVETCLLLLLLLCK